jgi:hypothetical protein
VGTACNVSELGKMARQAYNTADPDDVNNLYVSQVQCMVHPLCPPTADAICYMPVNNVTIQVNTQQSSYGSISAYCPAGTFVSSVDADTSAIKPQACCGSNAGFGYCCHIDDCNKGGGSCSKAQYINQLSSKNPPLYGGVVTTPAHWYQGCPDVHSGCNEGWGQVPDTYIVVRSITCTNDISKVGIVISN